MLEKEGKGKTIAFAVFSALDDKEGDEAAHAFSIILGSGSRMECSPLANRSNPGYLHHLRSLIIEAIVPSYSGDLAGTALVILFPDTVAYMAMIFSAGTSL